MGRHQGQSVVTLPSARELIGQLGLDRCDDLFSGRHQAAFQACVAQGVENLMRHGTFAAWWSAVERLAITPQSLELDRDAPKSTLSASVDHTGALEQLGPWKKGPFELGPHHLDAEWRSDLKWRRLTEHLGSVSDETILDVGTGNGYLLLRARGAGARRALGIEPSAQYVMQHLALSRFFPSLPVAMAPVTCDDFVMDCRTFDTVLSLGVLYHRKSPIHHIEQLRSFARPGGRVVVETIVVEGPAGYSLMPQGRYANMRNVWFLPSKATLTSWFSKLGLLDIQCGEAVPTTPREQRSTAWSGPISLVDALDAKDPTLTVEGHPAPQRLIISARVPT